MNYLGHLFLARHHPELMPGVFLGDHVKGLLKGERSKTIEDGIRFHRAVDVFTDSHPMQQRSISRLPKNLRRYGGIICDVVYDYYLANHWAAFYEKDFQQFCTASYLAILVAEDELTQPAFSTVVRMQENSSLQSYTSRHYIERSLAFIGQRLKRDNPLHLGYREFEALEQELEQDFMTFLPLVDAFGSDWLASQR